MYTRPTILPAIALALALGGATAMAATLPQAPPGGPMHGMNDGSHIEGHIAFLKAELKITPGQEALFARVAEAMRSDVAETAALGARRDGGSPTAVQELEARAAFAAQRTKAEERFLAAFRPLYDALSAGQKLAADELIAQHVAR